MIKRTQIEKILQVNGVNPSSPDEQIRSVLLSARFNKDEVDTAVMVLREDTATKKTRVDGLHKIFRTDEALRPDEISQLLGIEVDAASFYRPTTAADTVAGLQYLTVWLFSVFFATSGILMYMYVNDVGPFHPSVRSVEANEGK
jgi:hypothetical protein